MPPIIPLWFHVVFICAMFTLAFVKGDREARIGTFYVCGSAAVMMLILPLRHTAPQLPRPYIDLADSVVDVAVLCPLAIISRRGWTLAVGAITLVSLATSAIAVFFPWPLWVRGTANAIWYFMACAVLVFGCLRSKPHKRPWRGGSASRATGLA